MNKKKTFEYSKCKQFFVKSFYQMAWNLENRLWIVSYETGIIVHVCVLSISCRRYINRLWIIIINFNMRLAFLIYLFAQFWANCLTRKGNTEFFFLKNWLEQEHSSAIHIVIAPETYNLCASQKNEIENTFRAFGVTKWLLMVRNLQSKSRVKTA